MKACHYLGSGILLAAVLQVPAYDESPPTFPVRQKSELCKRFICSCGTTVNPARLQWMNYGNNSFVLPIWYGSKEKVQPGPTYPSWNFFLQALVLQRPHPPREKLKERRKN